MLGALSDLDLNQPMDNTIWIRQTKTTFAVGIFLQQNLHLFANRQTMNGATCKLFILTLPSLVHL
jgi:hypothetical protein